MEVSGIMAVQYYEMALKNTTSSGINISDLSGLYIPASGTRDITDLFPFQRLIYSQDLDTLVSGGDIILNVEGQDLPINYAQVFLSHHNATHIQGVPIGGNSAQPYITDTLSGGYIIEYDADNSKFDFNEFKLSNLRDVTVNENGSFIVEGTTNNFTVPTDFTSLTDTPDTYSGSENLYTRVTTTGIVFDAVDHSSLAGLTGDDHQQYILTDGSRGFTSTVSGVPATAPEHLATYEQLQSTREDLELADGVVLLIDYVENDALSSTTSTTYQTKCSISVPATISGTIRVMWSLEYNASANNKDVWVRAYNVTDGITLGENNQQTNNNLNWWTFAGFGYVTVSGTVKDFSLQFRAGTANCSVRNAHIEACRIDTTSSG